MEIFCTYLHSIKLHGCSKAGIILLLFLCQTIPSQSQEFIRFYDSLEICSVHDSLRLNYPLIKKVPPHSELPLLIALSYFPELKNTKIIFRKLKIKTTCIVRPTISSLIFNQKTSRKYLIGINSKQEDSMIVLKHIPFNAKIGLFGHELSHCADYMKKDFGACLMRLLDCLVKRRKACFEKEIDSLTILKGLGWQLYEWADYVLNASKATAKYKQFKRDTYLEPAEIKKIILFR